MAALLTRSSILAIHGLASNPDTAWTYKASNVSWLKDLLPGEAPFQHARIVKVNHKTRWVANTANMEISDYAREFLKTVRSVVRTRNHRPCPTLELLTTETRRHQAVPGVPSYS